MKYGLSDKIVKRFHSILLINSLYFSHSSASPKYNHLSRVNYQCRGEIKKKKRSASANIIASAARQIFVTLVRAGREKDKESECDKLARKMTIPETQFRRHRRRRCRHCQNQKRRFPRRKLSTSTVLASACCYGCYYLYIII